MAPRVSYDVEQDENATRAIAYIDGEQVGELVVDNTMFVIMDVDVEESYRKLGIATQLLLNVEEFLGHEVYHSSSAITPAGREWAKKNPRGWRDTTDETTWLPITYPKNYVQSTTPRVMYHVSDPRMRSSIMREGLDPKYDFTGYGAVYLSVEPLHTEQDVWRVYTEGVTLEDDISTPGFEGDWYMTYDKIPPERLQLMEEWEHDPAMQYTAASVFDGLPVTVVDSSAFTLHDWRWNTEQRPGWVIFGLGIFLGNPNDHHSETMRAILKATGLSKKEIDGKRSHWFTWHDNTVKKLSGASMQGKEIELATYIRSVAPDIVKTTTVSDYQGIPKFEPGDSVMMVAYGDSGTINSEGVFKDGTFWYLVKTYDQEGPSGEAFYPETDMERSWIGLDRGREMDQPSAWTMQDFGISESGEDYYRSAKVVQINTGLSGEHGATPGRHPWYWSSQLNALLIGSGGGTHMQILRAIRDMSVPDEVYDTLWAGVYVESGNAVVIHSKYDVDRFTEDDLDPQMIIELQIAFPQTKQILYRNQDNDYARVEKFVMMSKMASTPLQAQVAADPNATAAVEALTAAGGQVYVVGGAVRDQFLNRPSKDIDLMARGLTGDQIMEALKPLGHVKLTGEAFGVYRFRLKDQPVENEVEIALPRTERSTGLGHKDFEVTTDPNLSVEDDLQRRDFTGNAMAYDVMNDTIIDPFGGGDDLKSGRLRLVNDKAFEDDPLRIVRALVANARFGLEPDDDLRDSLRANAHRLKNLPGERIQMELDKLLSGNDPANAFRIAQEAGLIHFMVPELAPAIGFDQMNPHHNLDVFSHTMAVLDKAATLSDDPDFRLAALFHDSGKPASFWRDESAPEGGGGHFYKKIKTELNEPDKPWYDPTPMPGSDQPYHQVEVTVGADHEEVGANLVETFMKRLRYPNDRIARVKKLVGMHMFPYFNTTKGARKFLAALDGDEEMARDLLKLRESDASGKQGGAVSEYDRKAIDKSLALLDEVLSGETAFTVKSLAINGHDLMELGLKGKQIGDAQKMLLELVIDNPDLNNRDDLLSIVREGLG
jgi:tRNA nucleotidyltransferase (CCA-adding enzyme)